MSTATHRTPIRILILADFEVVREGLIATFASDARFEVAASVGTGAAALDSAAGAQPHVALVDLGLGEATGDRLCREIRERFPAAALVVLSLSLSEDSVRAAMEAGAQAYVTKEAGLSELRRVVAASIDPSITPPIVTQLHSLLARRADGARVTPRQSRVLELTAEGLTYREIGDRLFISDSTVRFHIQKLKGKFEARTKTDLIVRAMRAGILEGARSGERVAL